MASDVERYRPLVRLFAVALVLLSVVFTGVDLAAGMPWWWTAFEGPPGIAFGAWMYYLARPEEGSSLGELESNRTATGDANAASAAVEKAAGHEQ
jgi:hypothetical protein